MKITLKTIDSTNYDACIKLSVTEKQKHFVAPNSYSLVQAAYEPNLYPLGIFLAEKMVGFILYDLDEELDGWSMSRFMIDVAYQNRGIGVEALKIFLSFFFNKFPNEKLYTSAEVDNPVAIKVYENQGFKKLSEFEYEHDGTLYREIRMVHTPTT